MTKKLYVPLEVDYYQNDKMTKVSERAEVLYIRTLCIAKSLLTDGVLTRNQMEFVGLKSIDSRILELVSANLWEPVDGGWLILGLRNGTDRHYK
jgi:hypothetical protein